MPSATTILNTSECDAPSLLVSNTGDAGKTGSLSSGDVEGVRGLRCEESNELGGCQHADSVQGFDRRLSTAGVCGPSLTAYILLAINILREHSAPLAKRPSACF
jgi:hypothetical protein